MPKRNKQAWFLLSSLQYIMEEVLRKLYQDHRQSLQRQRIQKALDGQRYAVSVRKKYDFRQDAILKTPQTNFSLDEDIRFEKDFNQINKKISYGPSSIPAKYNRLKLPMVTKKETLLKVRRKFKAAVTALIFLERLKRKLRLAMLHRKRKAQKQCANLVPTIQKFIKGYYQKLLKEELMNYVNILQKQMQIPNIDQQKQLIQVLFYIAQKLAESSIGKDLVQFFVCVATERGFPPADFLSVAQINRLDFSPNFGCTINVSQQQTRMIIALGLGIKIFCYYILYQPWNLSFCGANIRQNYKNIKETINNAASVYYYLIYEQFCLSIKQIRTVSKSLIASLGVRAIKQLDPYNEGQTGSSSKALVAKQSRLFLNSAEIKYPILLNGIKENLFKWISRISYACLKQSQKKKINNGQRSTFFSTIAQNRKTPNNDLRTPYKSVELTKKRDDLARQNAQRIKSRYIFPEINRTIQ